MWDIPITILEGFGERIANYKKVCLMFSIWWRAGMIIQSIMCELKQCIEVASQVVWNGYDIVTIIVEVWGLVYMYYWVHNLESFYGIDSSYNTLLLSHGNITSLVMWHRHDQCVNSLNKASRNFIIQLYSRDDHGWWAWSTKKLTQVHLQESFTATW